MRTEFSGYGDPTGGTTPEHYPFEPVHGQTGCYHCGYALGHHPNLATVKTLLRPGQAVQVTNHYITREDHPCFGTNPRTIARVTSSHIWFESAKGAHNVPWPKAGQVRLTDNGRTLKLFGGGVGQQPTDPFLTIDLGVQS